MVKSYVPTAKAPMKFDVHVGHYNIAKRVSNMPKA